MLDSLFIRLSNHPEIYKDQLSNYFLRSLKILEEESRKNPGTPLITLFKMASLDKEFDSVYFLI